ncbi:MAG: hypothetical protein ACXWUM_09280 [Burkholderiaceae bacterium]
MTTDRDDASTRRYREANAALDERPSASTRAAILAAAARHVEAKPRAADAPGAAHRRRWPLAAAAALLLSTLAVMMAQRTEQEMPTFTAPAERSQEQAAVAPAPAPAPSTSASPAPPPAPPPSASPPQIPRTNDVSADPRGGGLDPGARTKKSAPSGAANDAVTASSQASKSGDESPAVAADESKSRSRAALEQETASTESRRAFPAPPAAAPAAPAVEKPGSGLGAAGSMSDAAMADPAPASRAARKEIAPAPPRAPTVQGAVREEAQRDAQLSAKDWIDRIVKLRAEARHADADAELKRFREHYPDVQVPTAALAPVPPATGTR